MTGGLLQIVARGAEDIYLSSDPNITFFKMVYRRHTNFSKDELDLNFNNKLTFGKDGYCKLSHYGDLVHRLVLSVKLPKIDIFYNQQTVQDIQALLLSCNIIWTPTVPPSTKFNEIANESAQKTINLKTVALSKELGIIDSILNTLGTDGEFNSRVWKQNNPDQSSSDYLNAILLNYFKYDKYNLMYDIIIALLKDNENNELLLANSKEIQLNIFGELLNNITSEDFDPFTYNDANIQFLYYVTSSSYKIYNSTTSTLLFNIGINDTYSILPTALTYKQLDAYKLFNYALIQTSMTVNIDSNVQILQTMLFNNIYYGLQANTILLNNIYQSLNDTTNFIFYRKFTHVSGSTYNINSLFVNQSETISKSALLSIIASDLIILPSEAMPKTLYNSYCDSIISNVKNFQTLNTNKVRDNNFNQFFNDFSLWKRVLVNKNIFFLDYIWIIMNEDIPKAIMDYVSNQIDDDQKLELSNILLNIQNIVNNIIQPKINDESYANIITNLQKLKNDSDFIMTAIFKPGPTNLVLNVTIPEYIINSYIDGVNTFNDIQTDEILHENLLNIIKSFMSSTIPTYSKNLNYKYANIQSSIVNNIFLSVVNNYNNLYNTSTLSYDKFKTNIGSESLQTLTNISNTYFEYDITSDSFYDYFRNNTQYQQNLPSINEYLNNNLITLQTQLTYFINNKTLLNMKNILISKPQYFYKEYQIVLSYIIDIIKDNPNLYSYTTRDQSNDIVDITYNLLSDTSQEYINPRNNALDITNKLKLTVTTFLTQLENPFIIGTNLYTLWNETNLNFNVASESNNFNALFSWLYTDTAPSTLYNYNQQINFMYDNFNSENDVYRFLKDYVTQNSFLKDIPSLLGSDINGTYLNVLNYFINLRKDNRVTYDKVHGSNDEISLSETLNLAVTSGTVRANFAWIKKIGHYLINGITLKFDDQTITTIYGEWMEIWHSLTKDLNREIGYNRLIGNITELYTFDNRAKDAYELLIPIPLWFCNNIGVALPLIAMHNSEIKINVSLKEFDEACYYDKFTKFKRPPKLSCKMIAEYIYVETSERDKIAKSKLQYQVDILQYNGDITITKDNIPSNQMLQTIIRFAGPCKELFWVLQDISYINGSLRNGERKWDKYDYNGDANTLKLINPIKQASIQFNGRNRENLKDSIFYNYIQPYEVHLADPGLGVNIYSFSLDPTSAQSMGTANMSKIDDASISMTLMPNVIDDLNNNKVIFRFAIYSLSINMLRVCSGLAGLMYYM